MVHGAGILPLLLDGLVMNRVPLRMKQFIFFESFSFVYLVWNGVHALLGIGNPGSNGGTDDTDDDAIYASLNWRNRTTYAVILSFAVLFVVNPVCFLVCRAVTLLLPRRIVMSEDSKVQPSTLGVEVI